MRRLFWFGVIAGVVAGGAAWWRRHPRVGAAWVNRVVDPWLVRQGVVQSSKGEIGLLEHVGRKTGAVRVTPVHPVRTPDGFRIIAPLGVESQWAKNVIAAGHTRLQVGNIIHELDEPHLVPASAIDGLPDVATRVMDWLGFRYLVLHQFAAGEGTLVPPVTEPPIEANVAPEHEPTEVVSIA